MRLQGREIDAIAENTDKNCNYRFELLSNERN